MHNIHVLLGAHTQLGTHVDCLANSMLDLVTHSDFAQDP